MRGLHPCPVDPLRSILFKALTVQFVAFSYSRGSTGLFQEGGEGRLSAEEQKINQKIPDTRGVVHVLVVHQSLILQELVLHLLESKLRKAGVC